jgi:hypothetical protein
MPEHEVVGFRELVAEIIDWRARLVQPEAREAYAISVVADVFELNPVDPRDNAAKRVYSASELLDQVKDVFEDPDLDEELYLNHLFKALNDHGERCTDPGYEGFGAWCDRLVTEAHLPHRELGSDGVLEMRFLLRSELRRRESPVVK